MKRIEDKKDAKGQSDEEDFKSDEPKKKSTVVFKGGANFCFSTLSVFVIEISGMGKTFGSKFSPKLQRKKPKASVALMKVFPNELEAQKNFDGFTEWLQTFELYRGKQGEEIFEDEGRVVGKFKVRFGCVLHIL